MNTFVGILNMLLLTVLIGMFGTFWYRMETGRTMARSIGSIIKLGQSQQFDFANSDVTKRLQEGIRRRQLREEAKTN
jgi:hypothetical protein